ncbi:dynamin family [Apiospora hydei]|uniref:Dynamin family n=1 Tax=Apiospora hydei TaxID=1337664 RepID=A0ABR1V7Y0_9PEZI
MWWYQMGAAKATGRRRVKWARAANHGCMLVLANQARTNNNKPKDWGTYQVLGFYTFSPNILPNRKMTFITARDDVSDAYPSPFGGKATATPATSLFDGEGDCVHSPTIIGDKTYDGNHLPSVPWPGNTYIISEKASGRPVVCDKNGQVFLEDPAASMATPTLNSRWNCVESNNHMGFQNPETGCYLGHDNKDGMQARIKVMNDWEHIIARPHPQGGYQLLSKVWWHTLKLIMVGEVGKSLFLALALFEHK